jgi:hypothetical protein
MTVLPVIAERIIELLQAETKNQVSIQVTPQSNGTVVDLTRAKMDGRTSFLFADDSSIKLTCIGQPGSIDIAYPDQTGTSSLYLLLKAFNFLGRVAHNVRIIELSGSIVRAELWQCPSRLDEPARPIAIVTVDQDRNAITGFELIA